MNPSAPAVATPDPAANAADHEHERQGLGADGGREPGSQRDAPRVAERRQERADRPAPEATQAAACAGAASGSASTASITRSMKSAGPAMRQERRAPRGRGDARLGGASSGVAPSAPSSSPGPKGRCASSVRSSSDCAQAREPAMEVRLHGPERAVGRHRDLRERPLREEAKGDDLAVRLVERGDRGAQLGVAFGAEDRCAGIDRSSTAPMDEVTPGPSAAVVVGSSHTTCLRWAARRIASRIAMRASHAPNGPSARHVASDR